MPRLLVMCDLFADPIWTEDGAMIELDSLPLSDAAKAQPRQWAAWYDRFVAAELEPDYRVGYVDERTSQRVWD
jgi:hypothetical protein